MGPATESRIKPLDAGIRVLESETKIMATEHKGSQHKWR